MFESMGTNYTAMDATLEIAIIVATSVAVGWALRWAWEKVMYEDVWVEDETQHDFDENEEDDAEDTESWYFEDTPEEESEVQEPAPVQKNLAEFEPRIIRQEEQVVVHSQTAVLDSVPETDTAEEEAFDQVAEIEPIEQEALPVQETAPERLFMPHKQDDLKIIEGVGPKIEQLLQEGGITTWRELADTDPADIKTLLRAAGERYRIHDPSTWPEQAMLAAEHRWDELEEFQDSLSGGKDLTKIYGNGNKG